MANDRNNLNIRKEDDSGWWIIGAEDVFVDASFVTVNAEGELDSERVLTGGDSISLVDGGANSTITVNMDTPGTLTVSTGNAAAAPHTHAVTSSDNPGAVASILASSAAGKLTLVDLALSSLTANTAIYSNASKEIESLANAAGYLKNDGAGSLSWDAAVAGAHDILSATHTDSAAAAVTDGDIIIGNGTPAWSELAISVPAANVHNYLGVNNGETRPSWKAASSNPGAGSSILASDASGYLQLTGLGIGAAAGAANRITIVDGGTVGQAAGPLLTFDDTLNYLEITGAKVGVNNTAPGAMVEVNSALATDIGLIVQGASAQSANLQEWQDSAANVLLAVQPDGDLFTDRWLLQNSNTLLGVEVVGANNLAHGSGAEGYGNTFVGYYSGWAIESGFQNTGVGESALEAITDGYYNSAIGYKALENVTTGSNNVGIGAYSGGTMTTGNNNLSWGYYSMRGTAALTGSNNTAIGAYALRHISGAATGNVAIGQEAGSHDAADWNANNNVFIGYGSGYQIDSNAVGNTFVGYFTGHNTQPGEYNVWLGYTAGNNASYNDVDNTLIINNTNSNTPLLYGEFDGAGNIGLMTYVPAAAAVGLTVRGASSQTANLLELQENDGDIFVASGDGLASSEFVINEQGLDIDFRVEGTGEVNALMVQGSDGDVGIGVAAPTAALHVDQSSATGAEPVLKLDQGDDDQEFIDFIGTSAADQTKSISTVNGDGAVTGPKDYSSTAGWAFEGMVRVAINGTDRWMPYYSEDTS